MNKGSMQIMDKTCKQKNINNHVKLILAYSRLLKAATDMKHTLFKPKPALSAILRFQFARIKQNCMPP